MRATRFADVMFENNNTCKRMFSAKNVDNVRKQMLTYHFAMPRETAGEHNVNNPVILLCGLLHRLILEARPPKSRRASATKHR